MLIVKLRIRMNICFERLRLFKIIICEQITLNRMQKPSANESALVWCSVYDLVNTHSYVSNKREWPSPGCRRSNLRLAKQV